MTPSAAYWDCSGIDKCECEFCLLTRRDDCTATSQSRRLKVGYLRLGVLTAIFVLAVATALFVFYTLSPGYSTPISIEDTAILGLSYEESDIARFFLERDLSPLATAALMGNMYIESRFNPAAIEQGEPNEGRGLMQWSFHPGRRQQLYEYTGFLGCEIGNLSAINATASWTSKDKQLEFLWAEMTGEGPASNYAKLQWPSGTSFDAFVAHTDLETATIYFGTWFLRHDPAASREVKHVTAQRIYSALMRYSSAR